MRFILVILLIFLLLGCAPDQKQTPLWIQSLETLPPVEDFSRAGVFTINKRIYVQFCDPKGNQIWFRYDAYTMTWRQSRYNTLGCVRGEDATGPESG